VFHFCSRNIQSLIYSNKIAAANAESYEKYFSATDALPLGLYIIELSDLNERRFKKLIIE
jgi:hypothetical protein